MATGVGIDLGARTLKVVAGRPRGPVFEVHRAFTVPVSLEGDPEAAVLDAVPLLREELGKAPGARYGVSGRELIIRYTKVPPVPVWRLRLLMDFEVREMAAQAGEPLASDYNLVTVPGAETEEETVLVAVVKERFLAARHEALARSCGEPRCGMPASLALFNAWLQAGSLHEGEHVVLVDLGDRNTEVVLERDGELLFARNMAAGGRMLTEAVAQSFGLTLEQAEREKEENGNVTPKGLATYTSGKEEKVANALIGPVGQLSSMIQSSLAFARAQTGMRDLKPDRILLSGGGAALRGLPEYLQSAFHCPVERFQPESGLDLSPLDPAEAAAFEADPGRFAVPLGLATSGSKEEAFFVDLVPEKVKKRRHLLSRTVFAAAAAVAALVFLVLHWVELSEAEEKARRAMMIARSEASRARNERDQYEKLQAGITARNAQARELEALTARSWAVARALRLVQETVPPETWVESLALVERAAPADEGGAEGRKRLVVDVTGVLLSLKGRAREALSRMMREIEERGDGIGARIVDLSTPETLGTQQTAFTVEIDLLAGERGAAGPEGASN